MELTATLLISKTFSAHTPGKSSQMRERLVKNIQLAEYTKQYGFEKRIMMPKDRPFSLLEKKDQIKIEGDVFEAYIAAVVLSDPANGFNKAVQWLKDLWGMTLRKDIIENEKRGLPESPMWKLQGDQVDVALIKEVNDKELLRRAIAAPGVRIDYLDAADVRKGKDKLPIFTVGVYLTGLGETKKLLATGTGKGKKDAGNEAARKVLSSPMMMKLYGDRKKMMEELAEREQAALASHGVHSTEQSK
jgi:ribonuclease-3